MNPGDWITAAGLVVVILTAIISATYSISRKLSQTDAALDNLRESFTDLKEEFRNLRHELNALGTVVKNNTSAIDRREHD